MVITSTFTGSSSVLTLGAGFIGIVRKMKLFGYAKIANEVSHSFYNTLQPLKNADTANCVAYYNNKACTHCDKDMTSDDTDFKYKCFPQCTAHQFDRECKECSPWCATCFGSDEYHCYSCDWTKWNYHYLGNRCIEICGDSKN